MKDMSSNMTPFTDVESNGNKSRTPSSKPKKEKHLIAAVVILSIIIVAFIIAVIILALKTKHASTDEICASEGCLNAALDLVHAMNTSVDPCDDFYEYACGNWYKVYDGPGNMKLGVAGISSTVRMHEYLLNAVIDESPEIPHSVKQIAAAYSICSTYDDIRSEDGIWLMEILREVGGWPMADSDWDENLYTWERNLAKAAYRLGIETPFMYDVDLDQFDTRRYIIRMLQHPIPDIQPFNKEQILSIAKRIGDREDDSSLEREYERMAEFDQKLQKMSRLHSELGDDLEETKVLTIKELTTSISWINWPEFLRTVFGQFMSSSLHDSEPVTLVGLNFISDVLELAFKGKVSKRTLANYISASFIRRLIVVNNKIAPPSLFDPSRNSFESIAKVSIPEGISGTCLDFLAKKAFPAVDFLNYRSRKFKPVGDEMLRYFKSAMKDLIEEAPWLDDETRKAAKEKLATMRYFSGFPKTSKDGKLVDEFFAGIPNITLNALQNQLIIERHRFKKAVQLLRKHVDKDSWPTTEGTHSSQLNAFYVPEYNAIVIPADIQVDPVISPKRPTYWNFGSFGWIMGHEVTHGFDTSGSKRDKFGNLKNWWMPKAKEQFTKKAQCLIEQYSKIPYGYKNYHVNGTMTVGENVADNGGLRQAYLAYKKWEKEHGKEKVLPGFEKFSTEQLFFLSVAQSYCSSKIPPELLYETHKLDNHSPTKFRFNPAAANFDAFGKAFKCKPGTPMNRVNKCVVW